MRRMPLVAVVLAIALSGCGDGGSSPDEGGADETLTVVASFYPVAEVADRVGGAHVEVTNLTPAGTEPHDLELTPDQVDDIEDADLVLYLGADFQPAVQEVAERRKEGSIDLLAALPLEQGAAEALAGEETGEGEASHDESGGDVDPHFWLDPTLMRRAVDVVEKALLAVKPTAGADLAAGADAYREELERLDRELAGSLERCARRQFVTSHAAFHYLARRYDLEQVAIAGLSPESEPDADRLSELADIIERGGVTTVFYETLASADVAETLAREAKVGTAVLDPIEGLSQDDLDDGVDYAAVMRRNVEALRKALDCP